MAEDIDHVVVCRLFSAGLALQATRGLMDGHPAADNIQQVIDELDQAIKDIRDTAFGTRRDGCPGSGTTS